MSLKRYPEYKPSDSDLIGKIPEGWETTRVKFLSINAVQYGLNISAENYAQSGVRFIRTTDIDDLGKLTEDGVYLPEYLVPKEYFLNEGDFLISRSGTVGRAYFHLLSESKFSYAGYLVRFTFKNPNIAKFLFYFTKSNVFSVWLESNGIESTIINVNGQKYANLPIALPIDKKEQRAIADFLDRETAILDALIAKKRELIARLQEKRAALISHAVTKGLDPDVPMKESGVEWLGEIPAHWEVIRSKWLFALRKTKALADDQQITVSQKYGPIYQEDFVELEGRRVMEVIKGADILQHIEPYDFVISMRSFQGGIEFCKYRGCVSSAYVVLIPSKLVHNGFFTHLLKSSQYIQALRGTTNLIRDGQAIRYGHFILVDLPIVPLDEQARIATYLDRETEQIDALVQKSEELINRLQEYRTALISAAVTGKIDVRAAMHEGA